MNNTHRRQNSRGRSTVLKVVILGDGGVGKSCLMNRFVTDRFDEHSFHTIGVEFLNKEIELGGETYTLQVCHWSYIMIIFHVSLILGSIYKELS
ncbi:Ras-related protein Rab-9B [Portunus trituberculatus]|uniref:Ras-related protein Rab-9B n=1 Tax=Portunus trituberculatus TaxID=210409 RepID=A0A5B7JAW6_PORTR|nr:Ras-related protein Rab-9B [Portunus trituberculatus]